MMRSDKNWKFVKLVVPVPPEESMTTGSSMYPVRIVGEPVTLNF
jgi:hypothetical protein